MVAYKTRALVLSSFYPESLTLGAVAATERRNSFNHWVTSSMTNRRARAGRSLELLPCTGVVVVSGK